MLCGASSRDFPRLDAGTAGAPPRCWTGSSYDTPPDEVPRNPRPKKSKSTTQLLYLNAFMFLILNAGQKIKKYNTAPYTLTPLCKNSQRYPRPLA